MAKRPAKTGKRTQKGREAQLKRMVDSRGQQIPAPAQPARAGQYAAPGPEVPQRRVAPGNAATSIRSISRIQEYSFIKADLRRVGILAGGMFAILIALSFVLR